MGRISGEDGAALGVGAVQHAACSHGGVGGQAGAFGDDDMAAHPDVVVEQDGAVFVAAVSVLINQDAPLADERVHSEAVEAAIEFALGSLDQRESKVVNAFFGIGQERETMAEIAEDLDIKRERVRQIRDKAVRKLRKAYHRRLKELHKQ